MRGINFDTFIRSNERKNTTLKRRKSFQIKEITFLFFWEFKVLLKLVASSLPARKRQYDVSGEVNEYTRFSIVDIIMVIVETYNFRLFSSSFSSNLRRSLSLDLLLSAIIRGAENARKLDSGKLHLTPLNFNQE